MKRLIFAILLVILPIDSIAIDLNNLSKITIVVVGEDNGPISDAKVSISFETKDPGKVSTKQGNADNEGKFSATNSAFLGKIYFGVTKEGYYKSHGEYHFKDSGFGRWKPWNPELKVILRKLENPVPMYVRSSINSKAIILPVLGQDIGFDLIAYDWVMPHGKGAHADIFFKAEKHIVDPRNFKASLSLAFPDELAGILRFIEDRSHGSIFKLPRHAPLNGYMDHLELKMSRNPGEGVKRNIDFQRNDMNYIFRTRTEVEDGKLKRAMYGKALGPIEFSPLSADTLQIYFTYYLNPDYTRNLEFDPKRNLFGNLPDLEQVKEP